MVYEYVRPVYMCMHHAAFIIINEETGEEQEWVVVERIQTMFNTLTWQELSR